ncbi:hypothetical protein [Phenylobacterium sp.]|uniref:hypothetical protein n=1 Tax=Phenylobacterium sp. TaxID=1871053 RepID=UPI002731DBB7|nr:hypothetical protein [Phenylobacterium sp.]MDP2214738.1 hypothetical protein [Phenylobacterium sp.]
MVSRFHESEYAGGFEHLRQSLLQGLAQLPPGQHAGSWTIGAYCALVRIVWEQRDPGAGRGKVGAILATVAADVLRDADGRTTDNPLPLLLEALHAAAVTCSPRDGAGAPQLDGPTVLRALGHYAFEILQGAPEAEYAEWRRGFLHAAGVERPDGGGFRPTVIDGGRS